MSVFTKFLTPGTRSPELISTTAASKIFHCIKYENETA